MEKTPSLASRTDITSHFCARAASASSALLRQ